jgi:hypothetical protein
MHVSRKGGKMKVTVCLKIFKDIEIDLSEDVIQGIANDTVNIDNLPEIKQIIADQGKCAEIEICNIYCNETLKYIFED